MTSPPFQIQGEPTRGDELYPASSLASLFFEIFYDTFKIIKIIKIYLLQKILINLEYFPSDHVSGVTYEWKRRRSQKKATPLHTDNLEGIPRKAPDKRRL